MVFALETDSSAFQYYMQLCICGGMWVVMRAYSEIRVDFSVVLSIESLLGEEVSMGVQLN